MTKLRQACFVCWKIRQNSRIDPESRSKSTNRILSVTFDTVTSNSMKPFVLERPVTWS